MFERRLRLVLLIPAVFLIAVVMRLYQLQVLQGVEYEQKLDAALVSPRRDLPALRGAIRDRYDRILVSDEPAIDVAVHYGALAMNESYLRLLADRLRRQEPNQRSLSDHEAIEEARRRVGRMWTTLAQVSGRDLRELRERRDAIYRSVESLRWHLWEARLARGEDLALERVRLREEEQFHAVLRDVSPEARTRIELELGQWPFVRIEPSVRRVWSDLTTPLCHLLGNIGPVSAQHLEEDPLKDDPQAAYRASDEAGLSGVERLAEPMLRGIRGYEERDLDGKLRERRPAKDGLDVQLTIDVDLQARIASLLEDAMTTHPMSTGASCVVLDVATREILAAVSVPTYDRRTLQTNYHALRDDAKYRPLRFRALQERYQPGSILKPAALLAAFEQGAVNSQERVYCSGFLIPGATRWHCWTHWRKLPGHGEMNAEEAIQHSCNVFFYTIGQRLGGERLTRFYRDFLSGPAQGRNDQFATGTQLAEESAGLLPTRQWLRDHRQRGFNDADGRNYAIGQGEFEITPLQAANLFATLAAGVFQAPTVIANDGRLRPAMRFPRISDESWRLTRRGLWRCVNEEGGTAYKYARSERIEICGKTGSAECVPRVIARRYTFEMDSPDHDGRSLSVEAPTIEAARELLGLPPTTRCVRREITRRWPPPDPTKLVESDDDTDGTKTIPTHAWFAGFAPLRNPRVALAVVVEYGGGGGSTSGPLARKIFEAIADSPHDYLDVPHLAVSR